MAKEEEKELENGQDSREKDVLQDQEEKGPKTFTQHEVSDIVKQAVQEALKSFKTDVISERERVKEEGNELANSIANAHTQLITPKQIPNRLDSTVKMVKSILDEHDAKTQIEIGGMPHYPKTEEGMFKSKIVIYRLMGMSEQEIAEFLLEE